MNYFDWKPEVGMEVFVAPCDTRNRPYKDTITKVGRSYFYVGRWKKFDIRTKHQSIDVGSDSVCYRTEEDYKARQAQIERRKAVEKNIGRLTDEQMDIVYEMIKDKI